MLIMTVEFFLKMYSNKTITVITLPKTYIIVPKQHDTVNSRYTQNQYYHTITKHPESIAKI